MKKLKKPKIDIRKRLPFLFFIIFLVTSISAAGFVYFLFNRQASHDVVEKLQEEVSQISITFNKDKIQEILQPEVTVEPPVGKKSPFNQF